MAGAGIERTRRASTLEPVIRSPTLRRLLPDTFHRLPRLLISAGIVAQCLVTPGCVHHPAIARPTGHMSYWEALAELHPADAVSAARTDSEKEFAEALGNLMSGDIETAEHRQIGRAHV